VAHARAVTIRIAIGGDRCISEKGQSKESWNLRWMGHPPVRSRP
jgi:hypothetical protein